MQPAPVSGHWTKRRCFFCALVVSWGMVKQTGGNAFDKLLKDARKGGSTSISVGVQKGERYPDGTSVAEVAAAHEFGLSTTEVPYFRRALIEVLIQS